MSRLASALALGFGVTAAALAFGSRPLGVAGVGLLIAAGAAGIWASGTGVPTPDWAFRSKVGVS